MVRSTHIFVPETTFDQNRMIVRLTDVRIIHLITTISRGGAENQLLLLAAEQVQQGFEVEVIPLKDNLDLLEEFRSMGVDVNLAAWGRSLAGQILAVRRTCREKDSIVHVHLPQAELISSFAGIRNVVCSRHYGSQFYPNKSARLSRLLSRVATRNTKLVIAISKFVEEFLRSNREVNSSLPIKTIHYGMNLTESARLVSERKSPTLKSPIIIGTLARLSPEKDLITVIKGFEILAKQMPNQIIQLHIYGEGDLRREFEQYIYERDLGESIFLLGKTQEPLKTISGFDLFVLASRYEGFGLVLLEALSLEIPVISSDIPTAEEVLGKTGVYFRVGEPTDLALKMSSILHGNTPSQVEQRERARKFDIKVKTAEILLAYSE